MSPSDLVTLVLVALSQAAQSVPSPPPVTTGMPQPISQGFVFAVTLGDIMQIIAGLSAIFIAFHKIQNRLTIIETQVQPVWEWFVKKRDQENHDRDYHGMDRTPRRW